MAHADDADRRLFFRGTRAKLDAVVAALWMLFEIWRVLHRSQRQRLRVPTRKPA